MKRLPRTLMPDPWVPYLQFIDLFGTGGVPGISSSQNTGGNNVAVYMPIIPPRSMILYQMQFIATNGTGNYDIGLYDGATLALLASSGSTGMSAAGVKTLSFSSDMPVQGGKLYYAALVLSSSSGTINRLVFPNKEVMQAAGFGQEASALPLPATATPVAMANVGAPLIGFGVR